MFHPPLAKSSLSYNLFSNSFVVNACFNPFLFCSRENRINRILISLIICICCICFNPLSAQILSVAPSSEFNVKGATKMVADRVDFNFSADFTFTNNTMSVDLVPNKITGVSIIQRFYKFTNTVFYMSAKIGLNYRESELNGIGESDLKFLYNNSTGWVDDNNSVLNTGTNLLETGCLYCRKIFGHRGIDRGEGQS